MLGTQPVRKKVLNILVTLALAYAAIALLVMWRERSFIYYPTRAIEITPDKLGWQFDDVWLTAADGVRIYGWFLPASTNASFTVLLAHGNAGNISHRFEKLDILRQLGADVFIFDYRGYGRSDGQPDEHGTYRDVLAAYDHLTTTRHREPRTVVVYGESLGAAVAVELATQVPVGGVILEEPFTSVADVGRKMFPYLPVRLLVRNRYDSLSKIACVNAPLLVFHSRDDEIFPFRHAERLLAAAREPKRLVELRGGHNDAFAISDETYRRALREFFREISASKTSPS